MTTYVQLPFVRNVESTSVLWSQGAATPMWQPQTTWEPWYMHPGCSAHGLSDQLGQHYSALATTPSGADDDWHGWSASEALNQIAPANSTMPGQYFEEVIKPDGLQRSYACLFAGATEADNCEELSDWSEHSDWSGGFSSLSEEPGNILVVNSLSSGACESLCNDATSADVVAIDAEWAPDFERGSNNPISILQFAFPQSRKVYVVQLERLGGKLPSAVQIMLVNPQTIKVGFGLDGSDVAKLALTGIAVTRCSMVDIQDACAAALGCPSKTVGLMYAARELLGFAMEKDKQLVCSDWSRSQLSPAQIRYAALDAWVTLRLYFSVGH